MKISYSYLRKIAAICTIMFISALNIVHGTKLIEIDQKPYEKFNSPIVIHRGSDRVEFHIARPDKNGISHNFLKKVDLAKLKELFLINTVEVERIPGSEEFFGENYNLDYSLTDNLEASEIHFYISDARANVILESLIRVIGKQARVIIHDNSPVDDYLSLSSSPRVKSHIVIDEDYYKGINALPPIILERESGHLELYIAPVHKGVSVNKFKKFETKNLKGLTLINSIEAGQHKDSKSKFYGNPNLKHSKKKDSEAELIYFEINNENSSTRTQLGGLLNIVGKESSLRIVSNTGVTIEGAFFVGLKDLYVESLDFENSNDCNEYPCIKSIYVVNAGMHADSAVIFNSKHVTIKGPIYMPDKTLFFDVQGACKFDPNGRIEELGELQALCRGSFQNYGSLKVNGLAQIETAEFSNTASWKNLPLSQSKINEIAPELRQTELHILHYPQKVPYNDIAKRKYEARIPDTGIMSAGHYYINVTRGDFKNHYGARIYAKSPPPTTSQIFAKGNILNVFKRVLNGKGYLADGFDFEPSVLDFTGNATFVSEKGQIMSEGSEVKIGGNSFMHAPKIFKLNAAGRYLNYMTCILYKGDWVKRNSFHVDDFEKFYCAMPGKGEMCNLERDGRGLTIRDITLLPPVSLDKVLCRTSIPNPSVRDRLRNGPSYDFTENFFGKESPSDHYTNVYRTNNYVVKGEESHRITIDGITETGSLYVVKNTNIESHGGPHVLQAQPIDSVSRDENIRRVMQMMAEGTEVVLGSQFTNNIIPYSGGTGDFRIGGNYIGGRNIVDLKAGMQISEGAQYFVGLGGMDLTYKGDMLFKGAMTSRPNPIISSPNKYIATHSFNNFPTLVNIQGPLRVYGSDGVFKMEGALMTFQNDAVFNIPTLILMPITMIEENLYKEWKKRWFSTASVTIRETVANTISSAISGEGRMEMNVDNYHSKGGLIEGKKGTTINVKRASIEPNVISYKRIVTTKNNGPFIPGIFNLAVQGINRDFNFRSVYQNVPMIGAGYNLANTQSVSDMAPFMLFMMELYGTADYFSKAYAATGSAGAALADTAMNQLGITMIGGMPVPSGIGYGTVKTCRETNWQRAIPSVIAGETVEITADELQVKAVQIEADKDFKLTVRNKLYLDDQALIGSESFKQEGKTMTFSFSNRGFGISGSRQVEESNSETVNHILTNIIAGKTVTVTVGGDAKVNAVIKAPSVKVNVAGKLLISTVQDTGQGSSTRKSINAGVSVTSSGVMPSGGFQYGSGEWSRIWADEQAGIIADHIEMDVGNLILDAAVIAGKSGYVNADSIEYKNIVNSFYEKSRSYGFDTNFVNFIINPANSPRVIAAANAIKGVASFGNSRESESQTLHATISENLKINTASDISGLNRDDTKTKGSVQKTSHKFSLALPVVDWKELGEGLERIGMTARDINQKRIDAFKSQMEEFVESDPGKAAEWQEVIKDQERIAEVIQESSLSPEAKEELAKRIFLLFTESGQYFVRGKASSEEQGTVNVDSNDEGFLEAVYTPVDAIILTVDKPSNYEEETYNYVAEVLGQKTANNLRDARSRWEKIASAAYRFGKGLLVIDTKPLATKPGQSAESVFELFIEALDDPRNEEVAKAGAELVHEVYEGLAELWENQQLQGGLKIACGVGEVAGAKVLAVASTASIFGAVPGDILAVAIGAHGLDQILTGSKQMLMNEEVPSMPARFVEDLGFSSETARNVDMYLAMAIPFVGTYKFLNLAEKSVELGVNAIRRTAQQSVPMFFRADVCPRVLGLMEKEVYMATNPLKLKQIPASILKEFEEGGSWIMTQDNFERHFLNKNWIGRSDGQFMVSSKAMDQVLAKSNGDIDKLQELLRTKEWTGQILYRLDIKNPLDYNPRAPHKGLSGANEHFVPGGRTGGGIAEIVTDLLPKDQIKFMKLNLKSKL